MATPQPKPADLRMILANNLRRLIKNAGPVSELCRQIGVNRTQFNRYIAGTAFPRPDVLFRICQFFEVDANILVRDLAATNPVAAPAQPRPSWLPETKRPFDHYLLPDGLYRYWRKSFRRPDRAYLGLARIFTEDGQKRWKGYDLHDQPFRPGLRRHARSVRYEGTLVQHVDGFTLLSRTPYSDVMNVTYFEYGLEGMLDFYSGLSFITRRRQADASRLTAIVMQRLPQGCAEALACARACGSQDFAALPVSVREAIRRVPEQI